jgi:hypothetical protein
MKKNILITTLFLSFTTLIFAQEQDSILVNTKETNESFTVAEFRGGYGVSSFGEGLKEQYDAGNFSTSGGFLASLVAYRKFKKVNSFLFGIKYKSLGAFPSKGDNGQELFFNYWGAAVSVKYFPFNRTAKDGLYLQADYSFINQFTQKYRTVAKLDYNHQFAIGRGIVLGLGYDFPAKNKKTQFTIGLEYETNSRTGEVTGIGKKTYYSSNIGIMTGFKF